MGDTMILKNTNKNRSLAEPDTSPFVFLKTSPKQPYLRFLLTKLLTPMLMKRQKGQEFETLYKSDG